MKSNMQYILLLLYIGGVFYFLTTCYCSVILRLITATPILVNGCSNITLIVQRTHKQRMKIRKIGLVYHRL